MRRATLRIALALPLACAAAACWPSDPRIYVYAPSPVGVGARSYAQVSGGCWWKDALGGGDAMMTECMGRSFHIESFDSSDPSVLALSSNGRVDALAPGGSSLRARVRTFGGEVRHASATVETRVVDGVTLRLLHGQDSLACDGLVQRGIVAQVASTFTASGETVYGEIDPAQLIASDIAIVVTGQTLALDRGAAVRLRAASAVGAGTITAPTDPTASVPVATYDTASITALSVSLLGGTVFVADLDVGPSKSCNDAVDRRIAVADTAACSIYVDGQQSPAVDVTGPTAFVVQGLDTAGTCTVTVSAPTLGLSTSFDVTFGG